MILSFAWTTEALIAGRKTMTRRDWKPRAVANLQHAYDRGEIIHQAWDKAPYAGGRRVGFIQLTQRPYLEMLRDMPEEDLAAEGGLWADLSEFIQMMGPEDWKEVLVIPFKWLGPGAYPHA